MTDSKRRFSWTVLMGDGLLLLCALMGLVGSFLSLYCDTASRASALDRVAVNGGLLLTCAALFGLTTLIAWSLPRFWGAAAGGLAALWAGVILWNRVKVVQGAGIVVRDISVLFSSRVSWGRVLPYETELLPAEEVRAALLFLLLALAGLALLLGWSVIRSRRWWVVLPLTLPPLLPGLLADLYPDWLSFMALAACWCAMLLTSLCRWAASDQRGRLTLVTLPAVTLTLAFITAIFPREGYTRPVWARKAEDDLLNLTSHLSEYFSRWDGPFRSTVTFVGAAEEADLAHAGPLNYSGRTVLRVTSDRGGLMYLRGSSLAVYEDGVWKALPSGTYDAYWSGQKPEVSPLYLPAMQEQDNSPVYTVTVDNIGAVGTCVYAPYFLLPQDVNETGMLPVEDAYLARKQGQWVHTMTFVDRYPEIEIGDFRPGDGGAYASGGVSGDAVIIYGNHGEDFTAYGNDGPVQSAAPSYAGYVYEHYLDVPEDLRETLEYYAMDAATFPFMSSRYFLNYYSSYQRIQVAEQCGRLLSRLCQYDDGAPAAPEGVDPVYYFLTESHRGYCMHYASAVTLMLRTAGIPARYVSGFAAKVPSGQQKDIPDRAAHAWVEVWLDGFGWYPVEVTPADAFQWMEQFNVLPTDEPVEDTPEPTPEPTETPGPTNAPDQPTASLPGSEDGPGGPEQDESGFDFSVLFPVFKGIAWFTGVLFVIWSVQFSVKRFRARRMTGADANRSALTCYGYLCRLERWGGRMDPRAMELAQKARFSQHTLTEEELSLLRHLVDRERSRLYVVSGLPQRLAFRYWWGRPNPPVPPSDWTPPPQGE